MEIDLEVHVVEHETEAAGPNAGENAMHDGEVHGEDEVGASSPTTEFVSTEEINFEPCRRMEFESKEVAFSFYREYARLVGFDTVIKNSRRSKCSGEFIDANFACSRHGSKRQSGETRNRRPSLKTGCKASMNVRRRGDGKWFIQNFLKEHNHNLSPTQSHYFQSHKSVTSIIKNEGDMHDVRGQTSKSCVVPSKQSKGYENVGFLEKDITNQIDKERHLAIEAEDAKVMLEMFIHMQEENPNFFYAIDVDAEQRMKNVFWVDAKGRNDYIDFGDVVCFDTIYLTRKYKIPFAPFIGVNHHFQSTLFGCALIGDETKSTFVWLMRTWLRAMGGMSPRTIVTDQNKAMKAAVAEVFPNADHRFCLWHILRKIPKKLGHITKKYEGFMSEFNNCIYRSWTEEEFEMRWQKMVHFFGLRQDEWVKSLYEDCRQWVPTYMKDTFFAGMCTTQRSESINSFFDKYVQKRTTLKEFLEKYKVILQDRYDKESKADFDTWRGIPALKFHSPYEKQMSMVYTNEIFKKFQAEVLGIVSCHVKKEKEDGAIMTFRVQDFEMQQDLRVIWDETKSELSCLCRSFEYKGFLCRHAMVVLRTLCVCEIPSHYILKRWMKDAKSGHTMRQRSGELQSRTQRYNDLCQQSLRLFEDGSLSQENYSIVLHALEEAEKQLNSQASTCDGYYGSQQNMPRLEYFNLGSTPLQDTTYITFA